MNRRVGWPNLGPALVGTMTVSSFQIFVLAVLAPDFLTQFGLSRAELALIGSLNTLVGGLSAPASGRLADRIGPARAVVAAIAMSAIGMALMASAPNVAVLALSAVVLGVPQGWCNPATNALIAERVSPDRRGMLMGIKQSGVQLGIFLAGLTLPSLAVLFGWRGALWGYAVAFAGFGFWAKWRLDRPPSPDPAAGADPAGAGLESVDGAVGLDPTGVDAAGAVRWIRRLAVFAFCAGTAGGAVGRFFPLWAQETVGLSARRAGLLVALGGLFGIFARIAAARSASRSADPGELLAKLALVGALYCATLAATTRVGPWILWPATVMNAVGIGAWNAVAMLAVVVSVPADRAGRASGVVMLGFLTGLGIGPPLAGFVVDRLGTYQPVWWAAVSLMLAASLIARARPSR